MSRVDAKPDANVEDNLPTNLKVLYNQNIRQSDPFPVAPQTNNPTEIWGFNASSSSHAASSKLAWPLLRVSSSQRGSNQKADSKSLGTKNEWRILARWTTEANIVVLNDDGDPLGREKL